MDPPGTGTVRILLDDFTDVDVDSVFSEAMPVDFKRSTDLIDHHEVATDPNFAL